MLLVKIQNNKVVKYPYTRKDLVQDNPNVSFPETIDPTQLADYGVYQVAYAERNTTNYDPLTQNFVENNPIKVNGKWTQKWEIVPATPYEIQMRAEARIPKSVTMRQAELALLDADLLDDIEDLIPTLPRAAQIEWKRASVVERSNPLVEYIRVTKGLTVEDIDNLFITAATL